MTEVLAAAARGEPGAAAELLPLVYDELRRLAAAAAGGGAAGPHPRPDGPGPRGVPAAGRRSQTFDGRGHFFAAAAEAMRRILVDNARRRHAVKHGGGLEPPGRWRGALAAPEGGRRRSCWRWTRCWTGSRPSTRRRRSW